MHDAPKQEYVQPEMFPPSPPQVVLSRGGYTSAIDLWSLGCIFGELLQRVAGLGAASTPQLQVAPMFAIQGKPKTPSEGYARCSASPLPDL